MTRLNFVDFIFMEIGFRPYSHNFLKLFLKKHLGPQRLYNYWDFLMNQSVVFHIFMYTYIHTYIQFTLISLVTPSLSCIHKHLLSSDWERRLCLSKYLDTVSVCLCVPVLRWSLQFLVRVFTFLSLNLQFTLFYYDFGHLNLK